MSIRIIRRISGWLLIVWLVCLPLGMVGCATNGSPVRGLGLGMVGLEAE